MTNKLSLQDKIKLVMQRTGMRATDIAYATGLPKESMYKWLKGTRPSDSIVYDKLETFLDGILERVANNSTTEDMPVKAFLERTATLKVPLVGDGKPVPYLTGNMAAGTVIVVNEIPELIVDRIDAPCLGEVEGLIEITSESMEPTFAKGCRIAITRLKNSKLLFWGECYFLIDKNGQGFLKRIYPGETSDYLQLVSDNPDRSKYPPYQLEWNHIEIICQVKAEIRKH